MASLDQSYQLYKRYAKNLVLIYNKRQDVRTYIELMLSLSVIVVFSIFAIKPTFITIAELRNEIKGKQQTLDLLLQKVDDLDSAQALYTQNTNLITLLDIAVPDGPNPTQHARQIEGLAQSYSAQLISMDMQRVTLLGAQAATTQPQVTSPEQTDLYPTSASSLELTFSAQALYSDMKEYISAVQRMRRPIFIDEISLQPEPEGTGESVILSVMGRTPFIIK